MRKKALPDGKFTKSINIRINDKLFLFFLNYFFKYQNFLYLWIRNQRNFIKSYN